jgi:hypothetical protein
MGRLTVFATMALAGLAQASAQGPASAPSQVEPGLERVLRHIPDDTHLLLLVPRIDQFATGVAAFGKASGLRELAEFTPRSALDDLLGKSAAAIDSAGPLAIVLSATDDEPLLIAALNADSAWQGATQPARLRDGVLVYEFGTERFVATTTDGVAIFAREKCELRRAVEASGKFVARLTPDLSSGGARQMLLHIDVPAWRELVGTQVTVLMQCMAMGMAASDPDAEIALRVWTWAIGQAKKVLAEAQELRVTLHVDADGVFLQERVTFNPDGCVAGYLKQVPRSKHDLLRGLPTGGVDIVLAYEWEEPAGAEGWNASLSRAMFEIESLRQKVGPEKLETVIQRSIEMNQKVSGVSMMFGFGTDSKGLAYSGLYLTADARSVQRDLRSICELTPELMNAWGTFPLAMSPQEPETVAGVAADVYRFSFEAEGKPSQTMLQAVYGKDASLYMAPHPAGLAFAFGQRDEARTTLTRLLATDAPPLNRDARVTALLKRFAPEPQLCLLVDLPRIAKGILGLVERAGVPVPQIAISDRPTSLAGLTFYLEPAAVRAELFVPAEPVRVLRESAKDLGDVAEKAY